MDFAWNDDQREILAAATRAVQRAHSLASHQASASVLTAQADYNRQRELLAQGYVAMGDVQDAYARLATSKASLDTSKQRQNTLKQENEISIRELQARIDGAQSTIDESKARVEQAEATMRLAEKNGVQVEVRRYTWEAAEAAVREAQEEIGLPGDRLRRIGYLHDHLVISGFVVTPVVAYVTPGFELRLDRTEVDDTFEAPLEFLLDRTNRVPTTRRIGGQAFTSWDIPWQGHRIWGATAGMLVSFADLLAEP